MDGVSERSVKLGRDGRYRCGSCEAVVSPGSAHCLICHADLEWPGAAKGIAPARGPVVAREVQEATCPRGHGSLVYAEVCGGHVHACRPCGGVFVENGSAPELLEGGPFAVAIAEFAAELDAQRVELVDGTKVGYPPCPACSAGTARRNFERVSGIMVDVCPSHGTWFDGGEIVRVMAFLAGDGLSRKANFEAREAEFQQRERVKIKEIEQRTQARVRGPKF